MLVLLGFLMVITFMILIMTNRLSAFVALVAIPVIFGLLGGFGLQLGPIMMAGIKGVAPAGIMILFAIFYFSIMINAGLFDPLVNKMLRIIKGDPLKLCVGTAIISAIVSLDGDGTTTCLILVSALMPLVIRLKVNPVMIASIGAMQNGIVNLVPWGGPAARIQSALKLDMSEIFTPMIPLMIAALLFVVFISYILGKRERARLGIASVDDKVLSEIAATVTSENAELKRPKLVWINALLTLALLGVILGQILPPPVAFIIGTALALLINYPSVKEQSERIAANAPNALAVFAMIIGAGIFMGILNGTKMSDAMANSFISIIPPSLGPHMALITAIISAPGTFFLSNDAFYFGILPILAKMGAAYGVSAAEIGRAGLMGQPFHILSPLLAAIYFMCGVWKISLAQYQKFMAIYSAGIMAIYIVLGVIIGVIPL